MPTRHAQNSKLRRTTATITITTALLLTGVALPAQANALPGAPYSATRYAFCWAAFNPWMWFVSGATMQGFRVCLR